MRIHINSYMTHEKQTLLVVYIKPMIPKDELCI